MLRSLGTTYSHRRAWRTGPVGRSHRRRPNHSHSCISPQDTLCRDRHLGHCSQPGMNSLSLLQTANWQEKRSFLDSLCTMDRIPLRWSTNLLCTKSTRCYRQWICTCLFRTLCNLWDHPRSIPDHSSMSRWHCSKLYSLSDKQDTLNCSKQQQL